MAAVMASDSQILALSTMFTEDVFAFYGGATRASATRVQVQTGRLFVVAAHARRLRDRADGAAVDLRPRDAVRVRRLRGAVAAARRGAVLEAQHEGGARSRSPSGRPRRCWPSRCCRSVVPAPPPGTAVDVLTIGGVDVVTRAAAGTMVLGFLPVVPMTLISALLMVIVSRCDAGVAARRRDAREVLLMNDDSGSDRRHAGASDAAAMADLRSSPRSASRSTPTSC